MPSLLPAYGRVALSGATRAIGAIPGSGLLSRLPVVPGGAGGAPPDERGLAIDAVAVDVDALAAYCRICGFTMRDTLPATYPHVLSFPLQMSLMSGDNFPFPLLGLVHLDNSITQHRPIATSERLDLAVRAEDLRPHPKGEAISLIAEARAGDELVWEETGTLLRRGPGDPRVPAPSRPNPPADDLVPTAEWRLGEDLGRRYAGASGDRNPIHIHRLSARALGFPRAIAHGMWSMARCLAQLEGRLPDALTAEARFRKPVLLPGNVEFATEEQEGGRISFAIRGARPGPGGAPPPVHLEGEVRPLG
jgi:acyl dehydratase